jgi:hypothetical protein
MPLKSGKANIGRNIAELEKPSKNAPDGRPYKQALAIALKYTQKRASGGRVGSIRGDTDGRADALKTSVPNGSHVIPADIVSALGNGNSASGFKILEKQFPRTKKWATGGAVKVRLSDGEFVLTPENVAALGEGDPERGHRAADAWIMHVRNEDIERRKRLPPPVGS